ncbi:MAG: heme-dependent oxidative N-demethylase family protein [Amylibacter sp.]
MQNYFKNIFQDSLPLSPWQELSLKNLPGINPLDRKDWILVDSAFNKQMQYADYLLKEYKDEVLECNECATDASKELLENILNTLKDKKEYFVTAQSITRPDGAIIEIDWEQSLLTSRLLVQQDLCIMLKNKEEHFLGGAAMCFPASWKLSEKIMKPMSIIHKPVDEFTDNIARRVERMFCLMSSKQDLWRANWLIYSDPNLHQPRRQAELRPRNFGEEFWVRVERQTFCKLPKTKAVIFGIHTYVVPFSKLNNVQRKSISNIIN